MAKNFYQTHRESNGNKYYPEKSKQKSKTVPGRSLSPQQVLERFASGRGLSAPPSYFEGPDDWDGNNRMPDLSMMDFTDLDNLKRENDARVETLRAQLELSKSEAKKRYLDRMAKEKQRQEAIDKALLAKAEQEKPVQK